MEETVSHPLLKLCEREVEPGFHNFKRKAPGWRNQGTISGGTFCPIQPESGQLIQGDVSQWKKPGKRSLIRVTLITASPLLNTKPSGNIELIKVKGQSHSRILSHLIVALSVESSLCLFSNFRVFMCYSNLPIADDGFTCGSL